MIYLSEYNVDTFKGISNLHISDLGDVNIILGDNNCGKSSLLESMMLLKSMNDFGNVIRVARIRNSVSVLANRLTAFDSFMYLFDQASPSLEIGISGVLEDEYVKYHMSGTLETVLVDMDLINRWNPRNRNMNRNQISFSEFDDVAEQGEATEFQGNITATLGNHIDSIPIKFNQWSSLNGIRLNRDLTIGIEYVSPVEHTVGLLYNRIMRDSDFKNTVLKVIQLFDENISDLLYQKNEQTNRPVEYVNHKELGNLPLAAFGDGVKKVIALANKIAGAKGGILLIDEIDTSLHSKYFDDIFRFVINACKKFEIQLFVTTHNIEAIDSFLNTQDYDENHQNRENDSLRIITLRKASHRTYSRVMTGEEVYHNRYNFGCVVRI